MSVQFEELDGIEEFEIEGDLTFWHIKHLICDGKMGLDPSRMVIRWNGVEMLDTTKFQEVMALLDEDSDVVLQFEQIPEEDQASSASPRSRSSHEDLHNFVQFQRRNAGQFEEA